MIEIKISNLNNKISEVIISGHSNYAESGKDIVCAGVSSIAMGTVNALNEILNHKPFFAYEEGYMLIKFENDETSQLIAKTMIIQLKTIEESYKKNVKIINS